MMIVCLNREYVCSVVSVVCGVWCVVCGVVWCSEMRMEWNRMIRVLKVKKVFGMIRLLD